MYSAWTEGEGDSVTADSTGRYASHHIGVIAALQAGRVDIARRSQKQSRRHLVLGVISFILEGSSFTRCSQVNGHAPVLGGFSGAEIRKEAMVTGWLRSGLCEARGPSDMCVSFITAVCFGTYFLFVQQQWGEGELGQELSMWSQ